MNIDRATAALSRMRHKTAKLASGSVQPDSSARYRWIEVKTGETVIMETLAHEGLSLWSGTAMIYTEKRGWHWRCSTFRPAQNVKLCEGSDQ